MPSLLLIGGAGYIGSHCVLEFRARGWRTVVLDDLSTGHADLADLADVLLRGDVRSPGVIADALAREPFDAVVHCAARALVGESVFDPAGYFRDNVVGGANLVDALVADARARARRDAAPIPVVFSSTAAVYGEPESVPIAESAPTRPINPYGFSKLAVERLLAFAQTAFGLRSLSLRYFNAGGADAHRRAGERHANESHVIPNVLAAALGLRASFDVFGTDYPTRDGSCERDFVHVTDLASAHALALEALWNGHAGGVYNLGTGTGITVREVIALVEREADERVSVVFHPRRAGDPARLVADGSRAQRDLGWSPAHSDPVNIVRTALAWHRLELSRAVSRDR